MDQEYVHGVINHLETYVNGNRRVSSTLRHPAWEFSDVAPLSLGRVAPAY